MTRDTSAYPGSVLRVRGNLTLTFEMRDALKELSHRCKKAGGRYMDRTILCRALIQALLNLERQVDWTDIKTEADLVKRFTRAFSKRKRKR